MAAASARGRSRCAPRAQADAWGSRRVLRLRSALCPRVCRDDRIGRAMLDPCGGQAAGQRYTFLAPPPRARPLTRSRNVLIASAAEPPLSETHFGFTTVDEQAKAERVRGVFDSVAPKYDVMNDLMSLGLHRLWKAYTVGVARVRPGDVVLDIAG